MCVIVINAEEGIIEHDKHIAAYALEAGKPMVLVVNKWDTVDDKNDIKINVKVVYDKEVVENVYKAKTKEDIYKAIFEKIKEVNSTMPQYKAIRGMILTTKPLIKTTTNKIKRQANLDEINKSEN